MKEYIVVDLETTGLDPYKGCEIIEIGVTEITKGEIGRNYSRLIKPKNHIPYFITEITNITQEGASTNSMRGQGGQGGRPGGKGHKMQLNTNGQTNNQINSQITEQ